MSEQSENLCYFKLADGTFVCLPCTDAPDNAEKIGPAPDGTPTGPVELGKIKIGARPSGE